MPLGEHLSGQLLKQHKFHASKHGYTSWRFELTLSRVATSHAVGRLVIDPEDQVPFALRY
jgi:hypothetical protein